MTRNVKGKTSRSIPRIRVRMDDDVGYQKPPRAHRFKPGESGNPRGRPKGAKNEATLLFELLHRKVDIRENGITRKITILEAMLHRLVEDSLKGNVKSAAFLLNRLAAMASGIAAPVVNQDDQAVLAAYIRASKFDLGAVTDPS
jgi:hypothetical protein